MIATHDTEARRGRPRNESCTDDILTATIELVAEVGIANLTMDAVAARAGVGKATIYRRWSSKEALMLDAWTSVARPVVDPDTGDIHDDLLALLGGFDQPHDGPDLQRVFPQMVAAARVNPEVAAAYQAWVATRRAPMRAVLERAKARGELRADADLEIVHDLLVAPLLYRWLITEASVDRTVIERLITTVLAAVAP